jgi:hypothetical protein
MTMLCVPEGGMNYDWDLTYIIDGELRLRDLQYHAVINKEFPLARNDDRGACHTDPTTL